MAKNYFEIFGPPSTKPEYFITHSNKDHQVGNFPTTTEKIIEGIHFTVIKIIPRILICIITPFMPDYFLTFASKIIAIPILLLLIFECYPPSINTLYLINKSDESEYTYNKLLSFSKDLSKGFCVFKKSFVVKNTSKPGLFRLAKTLSNFIDLNDYQKIYNVGSKKAFNKQYQKIVNNV